MGQRMGIMGSALLYKYISVNNLEGNQHWSTLEQCLVYTSAVLWNNPSFYG